MLISDKADDFRGANAAASLKRADELDRMEIVLDFRGANAAASLKPAQHEPRVRHGLLRLPRRKCRGLIEAT